MLRTDDTARPSVIETMEVMERRHIERSLRASRGMIQGRGGAAEILDINPSTLRSRMEKLGIKKPG